MVDEGLSKHQGQRKKRNGAESCINNVKLNVNLTSTNYSSNNRTVDNNTYTKKSKQKRIRGSLENVSSNPWGDSQFQDQSSLRRSRSLAISRENLFYSLDFSGKLQRQQHQQQHRRSQLIPRAKLIERASSKYKVSSVENLEGYGRTQIRRKSPLTPPDYTPPEEESPLQARHKAQEEQEENIYYYPEQQNNDHKQQPDSLDSNYHNKSSVNSVFRLSYDELPGLSLPNYYPDSKYDTDNTDNVSLIDNVSSVSLDNNNNSTGGAKTKFASCDNISGIKWEVNEHDSISYDENIVLTANKSLYDRDNFEGRNKPRTIRGPTPFTDNYFYTQNQPIYSSIPTHLDEDKPNIISQKTETLKEEHFESSEESVVNRQNTFSNYSNIETNPLYEQFETAEESTPIPSENPETHHKPLIHSKQVNNTTIKTLIEVEASNNIEHQSEQYKTIVAVEVDSNQSTIQNIEIVDDKSNRKTKLSSRKESKHHSHNYLKEFLESQKGSTKPLQNFIAKKFSNLSRRNSKEISTNLAENQYHSLPDITASKNLRKCEKIDRKLRKCERTDLTKTKSESTENRFIVNIGKHFDITANSSIPLDFEVKIAKVPKKNKKNSIKIKPKSDEQLIEAVKNLKQTLHGSYDSLDQYNKPEIVAVQPKKLDEEAEDMATFEDSKKEYQEKLGSMRNYWKKFIVKEKSKEEDLEPKHAETSPPCKIVEVQTKVEDVKKKFEPAEPEPEKPPNKVQLTKQFFEPKIPDKVEKVSPFIKETCSYFESSEKNLESLNPNSVEIIDKKDLTKSPTTKRKPHKPVSKSKSITYPEFDHVRYRVVKSDLFQKKIFANCEKESQFDGLMQYLQDYSFQELLIDNNIVIIEPIRTKIQYEKTGSSILNSPKNVTSMIHKPPQNEEVEESKLRRHFFYHPIRVNKEVNDDELPNPDTVRQARQFFEGGIKRSRSNENFEGSNKEKFAAKQTDPDKDRCSATDSNSHPSNLSDFEGSQENLYDSIANSEHCCEQQYVSEDILEKIRECGTTVTYYGGRVVKEEVGQPVLTKAIMEEIKNNEQRCTECSCRKNSLTDKSKEVYQGVKFRLVKSNSCSSRLELVGTENLEKSKKKYLAKHRQLMKRHLSSKEENNNSIKEVTIENETIEKPVQKDTINENIRRLKSNQPKIIGEERKVPDNNKMMQWGEMTKEKTYSSITFNDKPSHKITYDFHNLDKLKTKTKTISDMEFEPYEVA